MLQGVLGAQGARVGLYARFDGCHSPCQPPLPSRQGWAGFLTSQDIRARPLEEDKPRLGGASGPLCPGLLVGPGV